MGTTVEKRKYTYEDYLKMTPPDGRYELIEGELQMTPSPVWKHQRISRKLVVRMDEFIEPHKTPGSCRGM